MPFHEICPFRIGSRVKIAKTSAFAGEWQGEYSVVGINWNYQSSKGDGTLVTLAIASDQELEGKMAPTDGWCIDELTPA